MPRKSHTLRALDQPNTNAPIAGASDDSADDLAPPIVSTALEPPVNLVLVASLARSAGTPTTLISATWDGPAGVVVDKYTVQWSTNSTFPAATTDAADTFRDGATINNLSPLTLYYVRVSAWEHGVQSQWSSMTPLTTGVNRVTTPADTVAPAIPTAAAAVFVNAGDLLITWTEPSLVTSPNFRDVEVTVWNSSAKTINYLTDYSATGQYIFTAAMNGKATSYAYDPVLYVELRSRSWGNQFSTIVVVGTITKAVPSDPTLSVTWAAAVGSLIFDWTDVVEASSYVLVLDGKTYPVAASKFVYDVARNANDHSGTPDPAITYNLKAKDSLGQLSTGVTGTSTLAPPATPTGLVTSWGSDTGIAGPDCNISWNSQSAIAGWILTIDGKTHDVGLAIRMPYTLDRNRSEHAGVTDPTLTITLVARDGLGQVSTVAATPALAATNVAPLTPTATLTQGALSGLRAQATSTPPADFLTYEYVFKRDGSSIATVTSPQSSAAYEMVGTGDDGFHSWTVSVRQQDVFLQFSPAVVPSAVAFEAMTLTSLRSGVTYTDSDGNTPTTLKALYDNVTDSGGVTYAA